MSSPQFYQQLGLHTLRLYGILPSGACACGRPSCPPRSAGKHPLRPAWQSTPPDAQFLPGENLGIKTGLQPSGIGLIALDVDDPAAFEQLCAQLGPLPETLRTETGRGFHLLFAVPPALLPLLRNFVKRSGIDLRAEGGQVVAAPSVHYSGKAYRLACAVPPAWLPPAWFAWLASCSVQRPELGAVADPCPRPRDDRWLPLARALVEEAEPDFKGAQGLTWRMALKLVRGLELSPAAALSCLQRFNERSPEPHGPEKLSRAVAQAEAAGTAPWGFARPWLSAELREANHPAELEQQPPAQAQPSLGQLATPPVPEPAEFAPRAVRQAELTAVELQELAAKRSAKPAIKRLAEGSAFSDVLEFGAALRVLAYSQPDGVEWSAHSVAALLQRCWCGDPNGFSVLEAWGNVLQSLREGDLSVLGLQKVFWSHPAWQGCLGFDEMAQCSVWRKAPPITRAAGEQVTDADCIAVRGWFQRQFGDDPTKDRTWDAINAFSQNYATFNSLQEWLSSLQWDGVARIDHWLTRALGAEPTPFAQLAGAKWLVSAVARAYRPGCKADHVLVLQGAKEGEGKSSTFEMLAKRDEWFVSIGSDLGGKESKELLRGKWIVCLDELASLRRSEKAAVKSFVTLRSDDFRTPYERVTKQHKRRGVFCGTLNEQEFLDEDPERRWWPVAVLPTDRRWLLDNLDQLWAEAKSRFEAGHDWWVMPPEMRVEAQRDFKVIDPLTEAVQDWLARSPEGPKPFRMSDVLAGVGQESELGSASRIGRILRRIGYLRGYVWNEDRKRQEWRWHKPA